MNSWKRMSKDMVRIFFTQNQHIAIVTGKRRSRCAEIELVEVTQTPRIPVLAIQCQCNHISEHAGYSGYENYCLVKPVFAGSLRPYISLLHREGTEVVKVEALPAAVLAKTAPPGVLASATGFSQNYSLDEAFNDALQKLGLAPSPDSKQEASVVDVVSMGAVYGGFSGYSRMFVRVEQSSILGRHKKQIAKATPVQKTNSRRNRAV
ncbi:MAG: hypothetical protein JWN45_329 [Acidobacteriaceae bacterium]|nr:hypothetical protein [Acidobacteriaceae bacterium]